MPDPHSTPPCEYAGFWIRAAALLVDILLVVALTWTPLIIHYGWDYLLSCKFLPGPSDMLLSQVLPGAALIGFWYYASATPGKMLWGLLVVDAQSGKRLTLGQCVLRCLGYFLSFAGAGLGFIWVIFDPRRQGWHDKLARTVVVRREQNEPAAELAAGKVGGVMATDVMPAG